LPAGKVSGIDISRALENLPPESQDIGLSLEYEGPAGSLVSDLLVVDPVTHSVVQATPKDTAGEGDVGMSFGFRLNGEANTVLALANPSATEEVSVCVFLLFDGKTYTYGDLKVLAPGEVRHVDIKRLRDLQVPGDDNDTLPLDLISGQAKLAVHNGPGQRLRLVGQSIQTGPDGKDLGFLSCPVCPPDPSYVSFSPTSFTGDIGANQQIWPYIHWSDGTFKVNNNPFAIDWYPGNSSIATVSEAWNNFRVQFGPDPDNTVLDAEMPNECHYEYDYFLGQCACAYTVPVVALAAAQIATNPAALHAFVSPVPVSDGGIDAVIARQAFTLEVRAVKPNTTQVIPTWNGPVTVTWPHQISGETRPTTIQLTNGQGSATVNLYGVKDNDKDRKYSLSRGPGAPFAAGFSGFMNVWFDYLMNIEFHTNCDGPTQGSYVNGTACAGAGTLPANSNFIALPDNGQVPCNSAVKIRHKLTGQTVNTSTKDRGPGPIPRLYWRGIAPYPSGGNAGDVSDGLAGLLGMTFRIGPDNLSDPLDFGCSNPIPNNPPASAYGNAPILWRFGL